MEPASGGTKKGAAGGSVTMSDISREPVASVEPSAGGNKFREHPGHLIMLEEYQMSRFLHKTRNLISVELSRVHK